MHVLVVKTSSMGDILHTLPALTDAMDHLPDIRFDWVVEEGFREVPSWHPAIQDVIPVALRRWRKNWFSAPIRMERKQFIQQLKTMQYDLVIDAQGLLKSAFLITRHAYGLKHGLDFHSAREPLASFFYDIKHAIPQNLHAVERVRALFAQCLGYTVSGMGDYRIAAHFTSLALDISEPYLVFLHSTTRANKHWPEENWQALIKLLKPTGLKIKLPWGTPAEQQRAQRLANDNPQVEVLPKLTLADVAAQLSAAKAVISVDTGLSHLAAALDKPNLTLYGPTDPGLIGGYGENQFVAKVFQDLSSLKPEQVFTMMQQKMCLF